MADQKFIRIENTKFKYATNFGGDAKRDPNGKTTRKGNIIIPDYDQAMDLMHAGFYVKQTKAPEGEEEGFIPTYYVPIYVSYNTPRPPKIHLITEDDDRLLDEYTAGEIDISYVNNVNVTLSPGYDKKHDCWLLWVRTMYVEIEDDDPYAKYYRNRRRPVNEVEDDDFPV